MDHHLEQRFLEAYDTHLDAIYRHCFFRVYSKARAEELAQETFMKTWQYLNDSHDVENLKAFLYRVANNLVIDESRKHKERHLDELLEISEKYEPSVEGRDEAERAVHLHMVFERLPELPEEDRTLIVMRYVDDLDPKDIAEALGTSANNVSVKLNRAVKRLRALVNPENPGSDRPSLGTRYSI